MKLTKEQIKKAKLAAKNEVSKERFDQVKDELKNLYERKARAEKMVENVEREITDYEIELQG